MRRLKRITTLITTFAVLAGIGPSTIVQAQSPQIQQHVAALKKSLAESQASLKKYEWIETTTVSLKGEEKSRKLNRCYYGANGAVQKVPVGAAPPEDKKRGLRGKIVENKKEELTDYMEQAVGLVKLYVPPTPEKIQASKDAGKASVDILEPGKRIRLNFRDYLKPGDMLSIELVLATNRMSGFKVSTYLETEKEPVTLDVTFATLPDATNYASQVALNAQSKNVAVKVTNSGHRKIGG